MFLLVRLCTIALWGLAAFPSATAQTDPIPVLGDNTEIIGHTLVIPQRYFIKDEDGNGVVHVRGDNITVDFQGAVLSGAEENTLPNEFTGKGIIALGRNITLKNVKVRGYKVGIHARNCPGLKIENVEISDNYRQHLLSTPQAEDVGDWIFPHQNDQHEWLERYGAGLYIKSSERVTLSRVQARSGQNGIILDRVHDSRVFDCDCSFLSGWGLAMWRSSRNTVSNNAFDFCVRGYSHGKYNRGQDSAGILMFEQNNDNVIAENSATHCGDGLFGFGGNDSLVGSGRTGNNNNLIINNDFSYAAAHGLEMTFSFNNQIVNNRLTGNAICGIWAGYSQDTLIMDNVFEDNGSAGYGLERGGVNIEHGSGNQIIANRFKNNRCGIHLWWDNDEDLLKKPWCQANHQGSTNNLIIDNTFDNEEQPIHLRKTTQTTMAGNRSQGASLQVKADQHSDIIHPQVKPEPHQVPTYTAVGHTTPVGAHQHLRGRQNIIVTEWGPYDFENYVILPQHISEAEKVYFQVLGPSGKYKVQRTTGGVQVQPTQGKLPATLTVSANQPGLQIFTIEIDADGHALSAKGSLLKADWKVRFFEWKPQNDPREHPEQWAALLQTTPLHQINIPAIDFKWKYKGPDPKLPDDHFATLATSSVMLPEGKYKLHTVSDDGIRVWIDEELVVDDWTWHAPKVNATSINLPAGLHLIRIEHFEIDGYAQLQFSLSPLE